MKIPRIFIKNYFISDKSDKNIEIIGKDEINRIKNVLRLKSGDNFYSFDGEKKKKLIINEICSNKIICQIIEDVKKEEKSELIKISAGVSLLKQKSWNILLQKLTELGISEILPFVSGRTIVRVNTEDFYYGRKKKSIDTEKKLSRWEDIIKNTISQANLQRFPQIHKPFDYNYLLHFSKERYKIKLIVTFNNKNPENRKKPQKAIKNLINLQEEILRHKKNNNNDELNLIYLIGPEGGFTVEEEKMAEENGFFRFTLFDSILRSETAAISTASILLYSLKSLDFFMERKTN